MSWMQGYNANQGYTFGYYFEASIRHLNFCLAKSNQPTLTLAGLKYLDLGCGQGLHLIMEALNNPESTFVGVDFAPAEISHANWLVEHLGLTNIEFYELGFDDLASPKNHPVFSDKQFDVCIAHGIISWIDKNIKNSLFREVGRLLRPGGVFYCSYNTEPGWLLERPFQKAVGLLASQSGMQHTDAIAKAINVFSSMEEMNVPYSKILTQSFKNIDRIKKGDMKYQVHEYAHDQWNLEYFRDVSALASQSKLQFLCSATLMESDRNLHPESIKKLLSEVGDDDALIETFVDIIYCKRFRRDIFIKGISDFNGSSAREYLSQLKFVKGVSELDVTQYRPQFHGIKLPIKDEIYSNLFEHLDNIPKSIEQLSQLASLSLSQTTQCLMFLMQDQKALSWIESKTSKQIAILNKYIVDMPEPNPYQFLAAPNYGIAVPFSKIDKLVWQYQSDSGSRDAISNVEKYIIENNLTISAEKDGKLSNEALRAYLTERYDPAHGSRSRFFRAGGIELAKRKP